MADSGLYECIATNKYGNTSAKGMLSVKQKTILQTRKIKRESSNMNYSREDTRLPGT